MFPAESCQETDQRVPRFSTIGGQSLTEGEIASARALPTQSRRVAFFFECLSVLCNDTVCRRNLRALSRAGTASHNYHYQNKYNDVDRLHYHLYNSYFCFLNSNSESPSRHFNALSELTFFIVDYLYQLCEPLLTLSTRIRKSRIWPSSTLQIPEKPPRKRGRE